MNHGQNNPDRPNPFRNSRSRARTNSSSDDTNLRNSRRTSHRSSIDLAIGSLNSLISNVSNSNNQSNTRDETLETVVQNVGPGYDPSLLVTGPTGYMALAGRENLRMPGIVSSPLLETREITSSTDEEAPNAPNNPGARGFIANPTDEDTNEMPDRLAVTNLSADNISRNSNSSDNLASGEGSIENLNEMMNNDQINAMEVGNSVSGPINDYDRISNGYSIRSSEWEDYFSDDENGGWNRDDNSHFFVQNSDTTIDLNNGMLDERDIRYFNYTKLKNSDSITSTNSSTVSSLATTVQDKIGRKRLAEWTRCYRQVWNFEGSDEGGLKASHTKNLTQALGRHSFPALPIRTGVVLKV